MGRGAPGATGAAAGPSGGATAGGAFQAKKVLVAAPPLASAATISDPTTSEDVQAGLRRETAVKRAPVTSTAQRSTGGSLGTSDSPTLSLLGSP